MNSNLQSLDSSLKTLNLEIKDYTDELQCEAESAKGRKEIRLLSEVDRCDDLMDKLDDLAQSINVELGEQTEPPVETVEVERVPEPAISPDDDDPDDPHNYPTNI